HSRRPQREGDEFAAPRSVRPLPSNHGDLHRAHLIKVARPRHGRATPPSRLRHDVRATTSAPPPPAGLRPAGSGVLRVHRTDAEDKVPACRASGEGSAWDPGASAGTPGPDRRSVIRLAAIARPLRRASILL